jgi:hypothetical protein
LRTLLIFRSYQEKVGRESSAAYLFAQRPTLPFAPAQTDCPDCQAPLQVYKTQSKTLHTLYLGGFTAHETLLHCERCHNDTIYAAEELSRLAPSGCTFGYEVLVFVGKALFLRHRRTEEVVEELRARQIRLSPSEVGYLARSSSFIWPWLTGSRPRPSKRPGTPRAVTSFIWMAPVKVAGRCS